MWFCGSADEHHHYQSDTPMLGGIQSTRKQNEPQVPAMRGQSWIGTVPTLKGTHERSQFYRYQEESAGMFHARVVLINI